MRLTNYKDNGNDPGVRQHSDHAWKFLMKNLIPIASGLMKGQFVSNNVMSLWLRKIHHTRVGDLSPNISIIGQLYYTMKRPFYLKICIKRLVVIVNLVYKVATTTQNIFLQKYLIHQS